MMGLAMHFDSRYNFVICVQAHTCTYLVHYVFSFVTKIVIVIFRIGFTSYITIRSKKPFDLCVAVVDVLLSKSVAAVSSLGVWTSHPQARC